VRGSDVEHTLSLGYEWVRRGAPHEEGPKTHLK
jgi:hypothetical protein